MAIRTRFSSLDMVRMAKFAKENPELKPIPLIKAYCIKFPEITEEQKLANIRNWLHKENLT
jgi:myo-inositol-1-phosphate synthase